MDQEQMQQVLADLIAQLELLPVEVQEQFLMFLNNEFQQAKQQEANDPAIQQQYANQIAEQF